MPYAPPHVCGRCGALVPSGARCLRCQREFDRARAPAHRAGYGSHWRMIRARFLALHYMCNVPGCRQPATDVHHVVPLSDGGTHAFANLQALCHAHHSRITLRSVLTSPGPHRPGRR